MMAERYLDDAYAPEAVAEPAGSSRRRSGLLPQSLRAWPSRKRFEIDREWTDFRGETHQ
jgi:hypothetical protein